MRSLLGTGGGFKTGVNRDDNIVCQVDGQYLLHDRFNTLYMTDSIHCT